MTLHYLTEPEVIMLNGLLIKKYSPHEELKLLVQLRQKLERPQEKSSLDFYGGREVFEELAGEVSPLNMCIQEPKQIVFERELYPTLHDKAGILYKNLIIKHCFANANKRTALASLGLFLKYNGSQLMASNQDAEDFTVAIALDSDMELATISNWIEKNSAMPR
ncbi:putative prophage maintenance system killer protein,putative [Listeria weihenstephanensis FSL R9-0317]|uniref:Fido domain-containing protein n=1 Tax=Listeria weihenstephanensis TaxID=1006155 RepID=A0A1S7FRX3_9LIST|nr:type II toxin-antitoxin system death-on-curing family toxin [Listeria weihenstephanensis]AQY50198.1 hypothetical protein UE46_03540 [Listeria weihenstephanensis]EUJ38098.1 putative prophage maintenance system killer protein,putative [Listeria weihenstephanensis FSL R9-0317]